DGIRDRNVTGVQTCALPICQIFAHRMIAKMPTIAAAAYKHAIGQPKIWPRNDLDYASNLLRMMFAVPTEEYEADPVAARALDVRSEERRVGKERRKS